jgi:N4-gp56 family major capsid protein
MAAPEAQIYNDPAGGDQSSIGTQFNVHHWHKKAIVDAKKDMYFSPLASTISMPKHYGKKIKVFQYIPLLDDRNINDQGIDATGAQIVMEDFYLKFTSSIYGFLADGTAADGFVTAVNAIEADVATKDASDTDDIVVTLSITRLTASATAAELAAVQVYVADVGALGGSGNLYGSTRDIGRISSRLPNLSETGGRVNRVGFTRLEREGSIANFGFFSEFTKDSFDFDTDSDLYGHLSRELVTGATQLTEAVLQKDLLAAVGVTVYAGPATTNSEVTAEGAAAAQCIVDYDDFQRLHTTLNNNRTPMQTKVITGSRMVDTKTVNDGRIMYIGSELESTVKLIEDPFGNAAFVPVNQYAAGGTIMNGEIGKIDQFRIVVVPEMLHWAGVGAEVATNPGYRATGGRYDVFPMLVVGDESFATIGFQTDGKSVKFKIITKMPGEKTADLNDPFGKKGFSSIQWWYGFLGMRNERLGMIKTVARM